MRVVGIIAEYNPFHKGHQYHIARAKEVTGADYCIVVLSGNFVQRGEPAIYEKFLRTEAALRCGADLVLELSSPFASGSAEDFASGASALLSALGTVDYLCFGSEQGDETRLMNIARMLVQEPEGFRPLLLTGLKNGLTWPQARISALTGLGCLTQEEAKLLSQPNHILGIEYCKALLRQNSSIRPVTILRRGKGYHDQEIDSFPQGEMASATGLRARMKCPPECVSSLSHPLEGQVPPEALPLYQSQQPVFPEDFSAVLNYALLSCLQDERSFSCYEGITADLSQRMERVLLDWTDWEGRIRQLKTRQMTYTRISRCLCHLLLKITAADMEAYRDGGYAFYGRILGFKRQAAPLLKAVQKNSSIPLITRTAGCEKLLSGPALSILRTDFYASHLWHSVYCSKYGASMKNEFNRGMVIL
ncbi:MAG TPA: nucleotidyltransferase family protein [Candidatus Enterocloster faecavium]|uniref:tRNA(Met) cytidine acetate ligase n=1 Tax=Candidatus Enterocloster faecavium TaxID=2838560 RepID=A0A9D2RLR6_9FIRM|nr:nucleotidyltransferase family protein [Candidatus Enterocloster faecavium]